MPELLDLPTLRAVLGHCLDALEVRFGSTVPLDADDFRLLELDAALDHTAVPKPNIGSLIDDVQSIRLALADPGEIEVSTWHALQHGIGLLRWLAAKSMAPPPATPA
jgi:hypothetical protein